MSTQVQSDTPSTPVPPASRVSFFERLSTGTGNFGILNHSRIFVGISILLIAISAAFVFGKSFSYSIDFVGGSELTFPVNNSVSTSRVADEYRTAIGSEPVSVQLVGQGAGQSILIKSKTLSPSQRDKLQHDLFDRYKPKDKNGVASINAISYSEVSSSWGTEITRKAAIALIVFLIIIFIYIIIRFEWEMALAAIISLIFDVSVTAGIYSIIGLEVSPATIVGLLTIMGFSLYDTVVVFDKVRENTANVLQSTKTTYREQANLALNQTLMRSLNTSFISILPIISLMVIAVVLLGQGTLKDLGLIQLVGVIVGTYSSIFLAAPVLVEIKQSRGIYRRHTQRVLDRRTTDAPLS